MHLQFATANVANVMNLSSAFWEQLMGLSFLRAVPSNLYIIMLL